jgi:hypothetical protein
MDVDYPIKKKSGTEGLKSKRRLWIILTLFVLALAWFLIEHNTVRGTVVFNIADPTSRSASSMSVMLPDGKMVWVKYDSHFWSPIEDLNSDCKFPKPNAQYIVGGSRVRITGASKTGPDRLSICATPIGSVTVEDEKCIGDVMIEIGGVKMMVPRFAFLPLQFKITDQSKNDPRWNCDTHFFPDVVKYECCVPKRNKIFVLSDSSLVPSNEYVTYAAAQEEIKKDSGQIIADAETEVQIATFPNTTGKKYFFLPLSKAPTADKALVTFSCSNRWCKTAYLLRPGLMFSYEAYFADPSPKPILAKDLELRSKIEAKILEAQTSPLP